MGSYFSKDKVVNEKTESTMSSVTMIMDPDQFETFIASDRLVLVDYYADWCPPCRMFAPILDQLSVEFDGQVAIGKVNVDDLAEVTEEQGIACMPTFIFYKNGAQLDRVEGASESAVRELIAKHK